MLARSETNEDGEGKKEKRFLKFFSSRDVIWVWRGVGGLGSALQAARLKEVFRKGRDGRVN